MIIKIKRHGDKWTMIDNVEKLQYDTEPKEFTSEKELEYLVPPDGESEFVIMGDSPDSGPSDGPFRAVVMNFVKNQKPYVVAYNTVAYVCGDTGKTIEKIAVNPNMK